MWPLPIRKTESLHKFLAAGAVTEDLHSCCFIRGRNRVKHTAVVVFVDGLAVPRP